jgi:hypothetical protein
MQDSFINGIFSLFSGIVGITITLVINTKIAELDRAKRMIQKLASQVAAYHKLEELYMNRLAMLEPNGMSSATIQKTMRKKVGDMENFEYPVMTANRAKKIREDWL